MKRQTRIVGSYRHPRIQVYERMLFRKEFAIVEYPWNNYPETWILLPKKPPTLWERFLKRIGHWSSDYTFDSSKFVKSNGFPRNA